MAVVKFINGKNKKIEGLIKCIDYVVDENKTEVFSFSGIDEGDIPKDQADKESLLVEKLISEEKTDRAINYITKDGKTSQKLITGINCSLESAFDEMIVTKNMYNKTGGRQFVHFVHSYHPDEKITPELAHEISLKLLEDKRFKGFEIIAATHADKNHLHTHFILNAVNSETGRKWNQSPRQLEKLKELSNKLCHEHKLKYSFANTKTDKFINKKNISIGEYYAKQKGKSWKHEAFLAIKTCKQTATSKEDFIDKLEKLGYKVRWENNRKNITFTLPANYEGKVKKINNDKFYPPDIFTKESLEKSFYLNNQYQNMRKEFDLKVRFEAKQELVLQTIGLLEDNPDLGHKDYPRSYLENLESVEDIKVKMKEEAKGKGLNWDKGR